MIGLSTWYQTCIQKQAIGAPLYPLRSIMSNVTRVARVDVFNRLIWSLLSEKGVII